MSQQTNTGNTNKTQLHVEFVLEAKNNQRELFKSSSNSVQLLQKNVEALVNSNSTNDDAGCSSIMDKVTTIHELNSNVDKQLNEGIAQSFEELVNSEQRLKRLMRKFYKVLRAEDSDSKMDVSTLQRKIELVDRDIRILENTLTLITENQRDESPAI